MVLQLKTCCCGCSLRTGTNIIGFLSTIQATVILIAAIMLASYGTGQFQRELINEIKKRRHENPEAADEAIKGLEETGTDATLSALCICLAIINAIHLLLSIMLIFGASAERARLVKPWIVFYIAYIVFQGILTLIKIFTNFSDGAGTSGILGFVSLGLSLSLGAYFVLVVNSFYKELIVNNFQNKV